MTQTELNQLTPNEKLLRIAQLCGYTDVQIVKPDGQFVPHEIVMAKHSTYEGWKSVPDYLNSLDAMHEADKRILRTDGDTYRQHLLSERGTDWGYATAEQRADAFLLTMG